MANIKTFRDVEQEENATRSSSFNSLYSPLNVSNPNTSSNPPLISFGFRNSDGSMRQVNCLEALFPGFKKKSFIFIVTIVQIVVFIGTWLASVILEDSTQGFNCVLYESGAEYTPAITVYHHVHRLFMPILLHGGLGHIFFNMLSQSLYGYRLEAVYGTKKIAIFYIMAGVGGNLLSSVKHTNGLSVGASSALFGIFALHIAYLLENFHTFGSNKQNAVLSMFILAIIVIGNVQSAQSKEEGTNTENDNVDNYAHLGGFAVGALMAVVYMVKFPYTKYYLVRIVCAVLLTAYCTTTGVLLATMEDLSKAALSMSVYCQQLLS